MLVLESCFTKYGICLQGGAEQLAQGEAENKFQAPDTGRGDEPLLRHGRVIRQFLLRKQTSHLPTADADKKTAFSISDTDEKSANSSRDRASSKSQGHGQVFSKDE